ncbi:MAG TPA: hypothetical protein VMZ03_02065 [Chitinophagaceae bacterium]|nr:hypothetical protein [Chitinophagaceae bacterium]
MKRTFLFLFAASICHSAIAQSKPDFQYQLSYKGNRVQVAMIYTPYEEDSTIFTYGEPMFGGQMDIIKCIGDVMVTPLARLVTDRANRTFKLYYSGKKPISFLYEILDTSTVKKDVRRELFRPIIQKNYFYTHGVNLFLNPQFRDSTRKASISIEWKDRPAFPLFYGFDPGNSNKKKVISTVDSVMFSLITGATDMTVDKFELHGIQNYIVLRGGEKEKHNRQSVRDYFTRFNQTIREYWNDYSDKCFSLVLQPFLEADHNIGGVAFANGFIGKYKADTIVNPPRIYTISHEIGHHWIGHKLEMNISNQWFGEGFNDYITFTTLFQSGLLKANEFENRMNEVFKLHYSSSIRNVPNDSVFKNYWKMGDYNKLPYRRGCIFAFYLDNKIRLASKGTKTIRDLLHSLAALRQTKPVKYELTVEDFITAAAPFVPGPQLVAAIETYIMNGNPIIFTNEMLVDEFRVSMENDIPHIRIVDEKIFTEHFSLPKH